MLIKYPELEQWRCFVPFRFQVCTSLLLLLYFSAAVAQQSLPRGVLVDSVKCESSPDHSYALYLPRNYSPDRKWPVVYIFEPAARGALPVEWFRQGAEKYDYILAGSNDARNGPWDPVFKALNAMSVDVETRFAVDTTRIYTAGFSGGARAAVTVAVLSDRVVGVIGCGAGQAAGFPVKPGGSFDYVGLVGNRDMNYLEVTRFSEKLREMKYQSKVIHFQGGHRWPDADLLESALQWLELQAMRRGTREGDDHFTKAIFETMSRTATRLREQHKLLEAYELYAAIVRDFHSFYDVSQAEKSAKQLHENKAVKEALKERNRRAREETKLISRLSRRLRRLNPDDFIGTGTIQNEKWWRGEIDKLKEKRDAAGTPESRDMAARVLDWLWRHCSEQSSVYFEKTGVVRSIMLIQIWLMVSPDHPYPHYQVARLYAIYGWRELALSQLEESIKLGFRNLDRIENDKFWDSLRSQETFLKIVAPLK